MIRKIKFQDWDCILKASKYRHGDGVALMLIDAEDYSPVAVCTVNIINLQIEKDQVVIKDYTENEGMLECLVKNKIVSEPVKYVSHGHVFSPVCNLLINPDEL